MSVEPRVRIGHYVLGETIGQGSFGKVKVATHEITGHQVAVKMLNRQKLSIKANSDVKIKREIRILKLLRHPHIIRLYEVIETASDIFMVMEFVEGGELFDYIVKNGRLSESQSRRFFQQIICAVEHIHHFRIIHRDLKPENLLLDKEEKVRIADFGLSTLTSDGSFLSTSCGSPNYAAPEIVSGKLYAGPEVDVWSCGVILYAFLCGRLPFDEDNVPALFKKIKEGVYHMPGHLPHQCRDLIKRMLVVDPLKRITIAQIRQHEWFQESLPPYLCLDPEELLLKNAKHAWDDELLRFVAAKLDVPEDIARRALLGRTKNDISVAYFILLDNRRLKGSRLGPMSPIVRGAGPEFPKASPEEVNVPPLLPSPVMEGLLSHGAMEKQARENYNEPSSIGHSPSIISSFLSSTPNISFVGTGSLPDGSLKLSHPIGIPKAQVDVGCSPMSFNSFPKEGCLQTPPPVSHLAAALAMHTANLGRRYSISTNRSETQAEQSVYQNWRLGLLTELPSNTAMREIYKILQSLGAKWKVHTPYHLIVRWKDEKDQSSVCVGVQLYRMHEQHDRGYLVDLYVLSDDLLPAVDRIHRLYLEINRRIGA